MENPAPAQTVQASMRISHLHKNSAASTRKLPFRHPLPNFQTRSETTGSFLFMAGIGRPGELRKSWSLRGGICELPLALAEASPWLVRLGNLFCLISEGVWECPATSDAAGALRCAPEDLGNVWLLIREIASARLAFRAVAHRTASNHGATDVRAGKDAGHRNTTLSGEQGSARKPFQRRKERAFCEGCRCPSCAY